MSGSSPRSQKDVRCSSKWISDLPKGLALLSANFFLKQAMGSLVEAFSKRAQQVYKDLPTKSVPRDF